MTIFNLTNNNVAQQDERKCCSYCYFISNFGHATHFVKNTTTRFISLPEHPVFSALVSSFKTRAEKPDALVG